MARLQVSSSSTGPANYTLEANPIFYNPEDSVAYTNYELGDGSNVCTRMFWDDRIRVMRWEKYPVGSTFIATVTAYFRSVEGQVRYFNFQNIASIENRLSTAYSSWKKVRIINAKSVYMPGGSIRFESFEVSIQPEK